LQPLFQSLRALPRRMAALPAGARWGIGTVAGLLVLALVAAVLLSGAGTYQYVFTNLTAEDSSEAAAALKAAGIPFRTEANGSALAVPGAKVHDARLLLATAGLPRGGGLGFELFDRGDLGVSEFTQRVNLRRATEGELARTLGRLAAVRSARVHLTLAEKGLYRDDDRRASAAVVLNLQPGRTLADSELAGVRHLVASAVPGLDPDAVAVMDGRGTVLAGDRSDRARLASHLRDVEGGLEQRIVDLIEPAVGAGGVVARVTANLDMTEVETTSDEYDGEGAVARSTRKTTELVSGDSAGGGGLAGAAANQPLGGATGGGGGASASRGQTSREDDVRNFEIPRKTTRTVSRAPRVLRLSAAVLVDGVSGKPRSEAEMRRLAELAKHAMGFDAARGDRFDISSAPFGARDAEKTSPVPLWARPEIERLGKLGGLALLVLGAVVFVLTQARRRPPPGEMALLKPGASVAELEAAFGRRDAGGLGGTPRSADAALALKERARELGGSDPGRAAHLLRAWVSSDTEARARKETAGG